MYLSTLIHIDKNTYRYDYDEIHRQPTPDKGSKIHVTFFYPLLGSVFITRFVQCAETNPQGHGCHLSQPPSLIRKNAMLVIPVV